MLFHNNENISKHVPANVIFQMIGEKAIDITWFCKAV